MASQKREEVKAVPVVAKGYLVRSYGVRPLSSFADVLLWIRNALLNASAQSNLGGPKL